MSKLPSELINKIGSNDSIKKIFLIKEETLKSNPIMSKLLSDSAASFIEADIDECFSLLKTFYILEEKLSGITFGLGKLSFILLLSD